MGLREWARFAQALFIAQILVLSSASAQNDPPPLDYAWIPVTPPSHPDRNREFPDPYSACRASMSAIWGPEREIIRYSNIYYTGRNNNAGNIACDSNDDRKWAKANLRCKNGTVPTLDMNYCGSAQPVEPLNDKSACEAEGLPENITDRPIHISTGVKLEQTTDFTSADGLLQFTRYYTSRPSEGTSLGAGWRHSFSRNWMESGDAHRIQLANGERLVFRETSSGFVPRTLYWNTYRQNYLGPHHTLVEVSANDHTYVLTYPNGTIEHYDADRALVRIVHVGGYTQTLDRSVPDTLTVSDNVGRSLEIKFETGTSAGLLDYVDPPGGARTYYAFESFQNDPFSSADTSSQALRQSTYRLTQVMHPDETPSSLSDNPVTTYHYEHPNRGYFLTGITDERGIRTKTVTYDGFRAVNNVGVAGRLDYSVAETSTTYVYDVTSPLGKVERHYFKRQKHGRSFTGALRHQATVALASSSTPETEIDPVIDNASGHYLAVTNREGIENTWDKDSRGLPTRMTYAAGTPDAHTIFTTWHPDYAVPTEIDSPLVLETYAYNSDGALTSAALTDKAGGVTRTTSYTYLPGGLVDTIDGPLPGTSDTVDFDYSTDGYVSRITDANGLVTDIAAHTGRGQPETIIAPNGLTTTLAYNARGWLTSATVDPSGAARITSFEHDAAGNITRVTLPTGGYYDYAYEGNGWITSITSSNGEQISFTHDNAGNILTRTISGSGATGFSIQTDYDDLSRMIRSINALGETTNYSYDLEDRITSITDPAGKVWGSTFDSLGRVIRATDPESDAIDLTYDDNHVVTDFEDARDLSTTYVRNGFGEVTQETSPDRGVTTYAYDSAGRMTRRTDADGDETLYAYDAGGRITARTFTSDPALNQSFVYDTGTNAAGFLTQVSDAHGTTDYTYNKTGELTSETRTLGTQSYVTSYTYSRLGQVETITYPSGREMRFTRDPLGRVTRMETLASGAGTWEDLATAFDWKPFGPLAAYTSGNGVTNAREVDAAYRLDRLRVDNGQTLLMDKTIGRDSVGRVDAITDALDAARSATFEYTDDGRLSRAVGLWSDRRWTYDAVGNRLNEANHDSGGGLVTEADYTYPAGSNRLDEVDDGLGSILHDFTHSASGDITTDARAGSGTYDYIYDAAGRLQEVRKDGATEATYGYDAFERRVTREITNGASVHYIFDHAGRPLAEHDAATGTLIREYHWLGDLLIATSDTFETAFVHGGHLGQPLLMTDAAGAVVWDAEYNPFGGALPQSSFIETDLRFPGQWAQGEAGLHQNWHRDYDPSLGRYIQADPLGMTAGQSIYGYVGQDPVNWVDPDGLQAVPVPVPGKRERPWWWWYDEPRSEADELFKDLTGRYPSRGSNREDSCIAPPLVMEGDFDPPMNRCEEQANRDFLVCRALPRSLRRQCWENAHKNFAECLKNL